LLSQLQKAKEDVFEFGRYVFGNEAAPHHREMVNFMQEGIERGEDSIALEPRGFAKSTWGNTTLCSYLIGHNSETIRLGMMSKSELHAAAFSRAIMTTVATNERFRQLFGDLKGEVKWTEQEWLTNNSRWASSNNVTLFAQGVLGQIVSKRFDVILCDDILDKENTATRLQMDKVEDWIWQTLYPTLTPGGVMLVLGTRWAVDDPYGRMILAEDEEVEEGSEIYGKGMRSLVRGAIVKGPKGKPRSLWSYFSLEELARRKRKMGSTRFACSMMNDVTSLVEGVVFRRQWFRPIKELPSTPLTFRMGVDLASSTMERADYSAYVITAQDGLGNFYVVEAGRAKIAGGHAKWINRVVENFKHPISLILIESVQFQSTLVTEMMEAYPHLPVKRKDADADKGTRAEAVAAKYEDGKVFHLKTLPIEFETELITFDPAGKKGHDDWVDALGYSLALGATNFAFASVRRV
jgi:predicted phage terminase large subunit-like protein